ncbi:MAG: DUF1800 domain-containing protein [Phycisphaerales bacterium]|nr:DUF1800 domain-containing protein [Phycisphaerae bacterium]NNF41981.1 DUF1800 domain-containing protein [Phycisphaerales bacterium]NNM27234.1 DUF1800 domain-containing protein [Phycisphaerales bacterium]
MSTSRRSFMRLMGATGATAALAGCDAASDAFAQLFGGDGGVDFAPPEADAIDLETHVLNRLTWGPRPGDRARVRSMGVDAFIEEQLAPERIGDGRCDRAVASIESMFEPVAEMYEHHQQELLTDLTRFKLIRGVESERQLHEVMVDFWTDHLNIVSQKGDCRWLKPADDRDVIRVHALGDFRSMIRASAVSPAMLIYLDGHDNKVVHAGDRPNENYARELLELHTLGVDGGYTQRDVSEVARCLSGWTYEHRPFQLRAARVAFDAGRHDDGVKHVLGHAIPAGGGATDLDRVLDIVCGHPATAHNIATKLCRRFIADPAPPEAIGTVAEAFAQSGGAIADVLRTLFGTDAFRAERGSLYKRPLRFVLSAFRSAGARTQAPPIVQEALLRMGHAPFQYPTPDGYPIEPEPWLGTLLWRWNFALELDAGAIPRTAVDHEALLERAGGLNNLAAHLLGRRPTALEANELSQTARPLALLLASPAFQFH